MDSKHLLKRIGELLILDEDKRPYFPQKAEPFINAVIEVATRLPNPEDRTEAITALLKLAIALEQQDAPKPAEHLKRLLFGHPGAVQELGRYRDQGRQKRSRFAQFSGGKQSIRAPGVGAQAPVGGIKLSSIAPPMPRPKGRPGKGR